MTRRRTDTNHPAQYSINFEEWTLEDKPASQPEAVSPPQQTLTSAAARDASAFRFISFGSGSSGNSYFIGSSRGGILIDAGVTDTSVIKGLKDNGMTIDSVKAILLTHDHSDHIKYVYKLLRSARHIRLFCTNRVLNGLLRKHSISKRIKEYHCPIFKEIPFRILDFEITAFDVPHDGSDNMGFSLDLQGRRFVVATDLGAVTDRAAYYISQANYLVMEANYDLPMLLRGRYPEYLKARIQTANGHMDNRATAAFLAGIVSPRLSHVFLCHISQENNTPEIAAQCVRAALEGKGLKVGDASGSVADRTADIHLMPLPRFDFSPLFLLRPGRPV